MQVVQEYERAVIFRLGRIAPGGAKGPGQCLLHRDITEEIAWRSAIKCLHRAVRSAFVVVLRLYSHFSQSGIGILLFFLK